jgi:hypothetical protein
MVDSSRGEETESSQLLVNTSPRTGDRVAAKPRTSAVYLHKFRVDERLLLAGLCLSSVAGTWPPTAPRCTSGPTSLQTVRVLGPSISKDTTFGIRELSHFTALISTKQVYVVLVMPEIKTYMPFPT